MICLILFWNKETEQFPPLNFSRLKRAPVCYWLVEEYYSCILGRQCTESIQSILIFNGRIFLARNVTKQNSKLTLKVNMS